MIYLNPFRLFIVLILLPVFGSCIEGSGNKMMKKIEGVTKALDSISKTPNSPITMTFEEGRSVSEDFSELNVPHPWKVKLVQSDTNYIHVNTGSKPRASYLAPKVKNGELSLGLLEYTVKNNETIPILEEDLPEDLFSYVEIRIKHKDDIRVINLSNGAQLTADEPLKQDSLDLNLNSGARVDIALKTNYVQVSAKSNSTAILKGKSNRLETYVQKDSKLDIDHLTTEN